MDAISQAIEHKIQALVRGEQVVMTDAEMDHLDKNTELDYASVPNPNRIGVHDRWLVYIQSEFPECPTCGSDNPKIQLCPNSWHNITKSK